ncbi:hypothetical protein ACH4LS_23565 [Streptomyces luteogriseus]|uniref:hypothetical protein n=1 Tax=Streptomyces luteogriseus TaxID=68233 RepID=UPI0037997A5D
MASKKLDTLRSALDELGIRRPIPGRVRVSVRIYTVRLRFHIVRDTLGFMVAWVWSWVLAVVLVPLMYSLLTTRPSDRVVSKLSLPNVVEWVGRQDGVVLGFAALSVVVSLAMAGVGAVIVYGSGYVGAAWLRGSPYVVPFITDRAPSAFRAHWPTNYFVEAIWACAEAHQATGEAKVAKLVAVSDALKDVANAVVRAHRTRGTVPLRSHRRVVLQQHARLVVSKLQETERKLDTDPGPALRELGELLLTIATRYAEGRIGCLLDDESLKDVQPVRYRTGDALRAAVAVVLTVATVFAVASLDLPQAIEGYVIAGSGVAVLIMVYGPQVIVEYRRRR